MTLSPLPQKAFPRVDEEAAKAPTITRVEVVFFEHEIPNLAPEPPLMVPIYAPGAVLRRQLGALRIHASDGTVGEHVGFSAFEYRAAAGLAPLLLGRNALDRNGFYDDARRMLLLGAHQVGLGVADIAMWDLAGRYYGAPIHRLLGGAPRRLRPYASTHVADREPDGLCSPAAFADFAEHCLAAGYTAFKIHPWQHGGIDEMVDCVVAVAERVGSRMDLMIDPFNSVRTFGDAVKLGRACDQHGYVWWEDPYRDGGISIALHQRLRELVKTPLLQPEHARGLEAHVDFMRAGATDYVRGDAYYDGVTGTVRIANAAAGFGLDVELHGPGPVHRQLMACLPNTTYYEHSLVHPRTGLFHVPVHPGYDEDPWALDADGCIGVPDGPGLGVENDWEYILRRQLSREVYE